MRPPLTAAQTAGASAGYKEAEPLYRETLALQTEVLGARHPDTLRTMHNLTIVVSRQGN